MSRHSSHRLEHQRPGQRPGVLLRLRVVKWLVKRYSSRPAPEVSAAFKRSPRTTAKRRQRTGGRLIGAILLYFFLAGIACLLILYTNQYIHNSPNFSVRNLRISAVGSELDDSIRVELEHKLDWVLQKNIFSINLNQIHDEACAHSFIEDANIRKQLPNAILVMVYQKEPAALIRRNGKIEVLDVSGQLIAPHDAYPKPPDLPILLLSDKAKDSDAAIQRGLRALRDIREASLIFWDNLETLDLSDPNNMIASLRNENAPIYLGEKVIPANLRNYLSIAQYLQKDYPSLAYIELGFPRQVAIKPWNQ